MNRYGSKNTTQKTQAHDRVAAMTAVQQRKFMVNVGVLRE
jgi:hypothetical protein